MHSLLGGAPSSRLKLFLCRSNPLFFCVRSLDSLKINKTRVSRLRHAKCRNTNKKCSYRVHFENEPPEMLGLNAPTIETSVVGWISVPVDRKTHANDKTDGAERDVGSSKMPPKSYDRVSPVWKMDRCRGSSTQRPEQGGRVSLRRDNFLSKSVGSRKTPAGRLRSSQVCTRKTGTPRQEKIETGETLFGQKAFQVSSSGRSPNSERA